MTHQREIILGELSRFPHHPTADELFERVKKRLPRISLATVYRNLEILSQAGRVKIITISGRQKHFDWDTKPHSHVYCLNCHRIDNINPEPEIELSQLPVDTKGYLISGFRIAYFGLCPDCTRAKREFRDEE